MLPSRRIFEDDTRSRFRHLWMMSGMRIAALFALLPVFAGLRISL